MALELPNWNEALLQEQLQWEPSPTKASHKAQPATRSHGVGRVRAGVQGAVATSQRMWQTEETAGLRAEGLDVLPNALDAQYWLRKAAAEEQAGRHEAAAQVLKQALERDVRPVTDVVRAMQDLGKRTQLQQVPEDVTGSIMSEVSNRAPARFTPSKTGLTGKALRVPSRFSCTPGVSHVAAERDSEAGAAAAAGAPKTLTKRLMFSAAKPVPSTSMCGAEPTGHDTATPGPAAAKQPGRHVSFGAGTVSPATRPAARRQSHVQFNTPQPTIDENGAASPAPSQVNSVNAGQTPYDSHLSGLFRKYNLPGSPAVGSDEEDSLDEETLVGKSPSWRALSASVSVSDSIRGLAKKYSSDVESLLGLSSPELSPLATTPLLLPSAAKSPNADGISPPLAPTPHHMLHGWQRNGIYESPSQDAGVQAAAAEQGAGGGATPGVAATMPAAQAATDAENTQPQQQDGDDAKIKSAVAQLMAPVLLATIQQIGMDAPQQAGGGAQAAVSSAAQPLLSGDISPCSGAVHLSVMAAPVCAAHDEGPVSSPAGLAATPMTNTDDISLSPISLVDDMEVAGRTPVDGIPRNAAGIPLRTPATVTVMRGGQHSAPFFRDDGLAANLFDSFDSPQALGEEEFSFAPNPSQSSMEEEEDGDTPNMQPKPAAEDGATPSYDFPVPELGPGISPEILGYHEQQEMAEASWQEVLGPMMPRSILKSQSLAADGTPLLGRAQRVPSPTKVPRSTTKELRALLSGLSLDGEEMENMGTLPMLSPVRAHGHLRAQLGVDQVVTPVRRSVRNQVPHAAVHDMLEQTNFSYVPNQALLSEDATSKQEKLKSAKKSAKKEREQEQAGPNTDASRPSQSTRKSRLHVSAGVSSGGEQEAPASSAAAGQQEPLTGNRRYSLRLSSMRTPSHAGAAQQQEWEGEDVSTPTAAALGPQAPVPQDGSPALQDALTFAIAAQLPGPQSRSARKSSRHSTPAASTPMNFSAAVPEEPDTQRTTRRRANMAASAVAAAASPPTVSLSPTEQGIRSSLRRSARKSILSRGG